MRYHYEKPATHSSLYGKRYVCNHPVYDSCALYLIEDRGLAVIQQRFDPWLTDTLYLHLGFKEYFDERSKPSNQGLCPTVTVRQIMWALKLKPIKRK